MFTVSASAGPWVVIINEDTPITNNLPTDVCVYDLRGTDLAVYYKAGNVVPVMGDSYSDGFPALYDTKRGQLVSITSTIEASKALCVARWEAAKLTPEWLALKSGLLRYDALMSASTNSIAKETGTAKAADQDLRNLIKLLQDEIKDIKAVIGKGVFEP
jgi:hypothetical protein